MAADTDLLAPAFLQQLDRLRLAVRQQVAGRQAGERRSARRGNSVEFADFRSYTAGDDLRRIDWNAFARLDRLFLKLFLEEQETTLHLWLDASGSMDWNGKFALTQRLAAALGYLALTGFDRVEVGVLGEGGALFLGPLRGRAAVHRLLGFLAGLTAAGPADLTAGLQALTRRRLAPGVSVVISDFLQPLTLLDGLALLQAARQELTVLQVLAPDELAPELTGDLRLIDRETGAAREVSLTDPLLEAYHRRLEAHCGAIEGFCRGRGLGYARLPASLSVEDAVAGALREAGLVK